MTAMTTEVLGRPRRSSRSRCSRRRPAVSTLAAGSYTEVARAVGDEAFETAEPFTVRIVPAGLIT